MPPRTRKKASERSSNQPSSAIPKGQKQKPKQKQKPNSLTTSQARPRNTAASKVRSQAAPENIGPKAAAQPSVQYRSPGESGIFPRRSARLIQRAGSTTTVPPKSIPNRQPKKSAALQKKTKPKDPRPARRAPPKQAQDEHTSVNSEPIEPADDQVSSRKYSLTQTQRFGRLAEEASAEFPHTLLDTIEDSDSDSEEPLLIPYCSAEQVALIQAILADRSFGILIMKANSRLSERLENLRNINTEEEGTPDSYKEIVRKITSKLPLKPKESAAHLRIFSDWWTVDRKQCVNSNEARFQRTLMVQMIDHHRLFFHEKVFNEAKGLDIRYCDFSVEQRWVCPGMPSRLKSSELMTFPTPQPDLCVSFIASQVIGTENKPHIPAALNQLIFFEGVEGSSKKKAFPFLMIEAKNGYTTPTSTQAFHQCLNYASQALHIMYEFTRETNRQDDTSRSNYKKTIHEERFFETVRVFTAVATASGVLIRIHRAVEIITPDSAKDSVPDRTPKRGPPGKNIYRKVGKRDPITKTYPLQFEHDDYKLLEKHEFTHSDVVQEFEKIIWGYGGELLTFLNNVACEVAAKFKANPSISRDQSHYDHGLMTKFYKERTPAPSPSPKNLARGIANAKAHVSSPLSEVNTQEPPGFSDLIDNDTSGSIPDPEQSFGLENGLLSQGSVASHSTLIRKAGDLGLDPVSEELNGPSSKKPKPS